MPVLLRPQARLAPLSFLTGFRRNNGSKSGDENKRDETIDDTSGFPAAPTTCCMSGCGNCVWLDYAEKLSERFKDGGEKAMAEIKANVDDLNVRAYLLFELRMRMKAKEQ